MPTHYDVIIIGTGLGGAGSPISGRCPGRTISCWKGDGYFRRFELRG